MTHSVTFRATVSRIRSSRKISETNEPFIFLTKVNRTDPYTYIYIEREREKETEVEHITNTRLRAHTEQVYRHVVSYVCMYTIGGICICT